MIKHYIKLNEPYRPELTVFRTSDFPVVTMAMYSNGFSVQMPLNKSSIGMLINALTVALDELDKPFTVIYENGIKPSPALPGNDNDNAPATLGPGEGFNE